MFPLRSVDVATYDNAVLRVHRELEHGWHGAYAHVVKRLEDTSPILIGAKAIELSGADVLARRSRRTTVDVDHECGLYLNDTTLAPSARLHRYNSARSVAQHVLLAHLFPLRMKRVRCLHCGDTVAMSSMLEHLSRHGYKLCVGGGLARSHSDIDTTGMTNVAVPMAEWVRHVSSLDADVESDDDSCTAFASRVTKRELKQNARQKKSTLSSKATSCPKVKQGSMTRDLPGPASSGEPSLKPEDVPSAAPGSSTAKRASEQVARPKKARTLADFFVRPSTDTPAPISDPGGPLSSRLSDPAVDETARKRSRGL